VKERLRPLLDALASFLAPGLLLMLVGLQVALGLRGFDQGAHGLLALLQVPGLLLGWGGVVLLLPLLAWMVLTWWGFEAPGGDLGGLALKALGSAVLGIAVGAGLGLLGGARLGGVIGGSLASLLEHAVGSTLAVAVLAVMAAPACVLALSLQKRRGQATEAPAGAGATPPARGSRERKASSAGSDAPRQGWFRHLLGRFRRRREDVEHRWYPKRRFDAWGNELPMDFGRQRDVGAIRFADGGTEEGPPPAPGAEPEASGEQVAEGEERLPTIPELLSGRYEGRLSHLLAEDPSGGPREAAADDAENGPVHVDSEGRPRAGAAPPPFVPAAAARREAPLPPGVRYAEPSAAGPSAAGPSSAGPSAATPERAPEPGAGVPEAAEAEADPVLSEAVRQAVRGPQVGAPDAGPSRRTIREALRRRVQGIRAEAESAGGTNRYLEKLEALGMFDAVEPPAETASGAPTPASGGRRKTPRKATRKTPPRATGNRAAKHPAKRSAKKGAAKAPARRAGRSTGAASGKTSDGRAPSKGSGRTSAGASAKASGAKSGKPTGPAARKTSARTTSAAARRKTTRRPRKAAPAQADALRAERKDPLFARAVATALDRGAASPVLLTRTLGLPFGRATALMARMVAVGVLESPGPDGTSRLHIDRSDWDALV
jgi:hypothetical protein